MSPRARRIRPLLFTLAALAVVAGACAPAPGPTPVPRDPVIIVAGTYVNGPIAAFYDLLRNRLVNDGYRPFLYVLPDGGTGDIAVTAIGLGKYVEQVKSITGSDKVDLIGHSQGGLVSRSYVKDLGGAASVDSLISLATPHYGTVWSNVGTFFGFGDCYGFIACAQMAAGSTFLNDLNSGPDQMPGVRYVNFGTTLDEVVVPYTSSFLVNDLVNTNVSVQDQCPLRLVAHITMATDGTVYSGIRRALRHEPIALNCFAL